MDENINKKGNVRQFNNATLNGNWYEDRLTDQKPFSFTTQHPGESEGLNTTTYQESFESQKQKGVSHSDSSHAVAAMNAPRDMPRELLLMSDPVDTLANPPLSQDTTSKEYGAHYTPNETKQSSRNFPSGTKGKTNARNLYESTHEAQHSKQQQQEHTPLVGEDEDRFMTTKTEVDKEVEAFHFQRKLPPSYSN